MIRRRKSPDGLPYRVYERYGVRVYSIGYKLPSGKWAFRFECPVTDINGIDKARKQAIEQSARVMVDAPMGGFQNLVSAWFDWQENLDRTSTKKRATSTIEENRREAKNIIQAFGHLLPDEITRTMGYEYLDACEAAKRPEKGNKEISLARLILEYGVRLGMIDVNPFDGLRKNKTIKAKRYVTDSELALAVEVGRMLGSSYHILALCLKTAYLCVGRSVEARAFTINNITDDGIVWHDGKDKSKAPTLFSWTSELRATIDEAKAIKRHKIAGTMYLFGNLSGQRYTKSGWGKLLGELMNQCETVAEKRKLEFTRFNLQHCRPKSVSDKLRKGDDDVRDATRHTGEKMIATVYDRRDMKQAKPAA